VESVADDVLVGVVAGVLLGVVSAPLIYAFWRGRNAGMIKAVPQHAWRSGTIAGCACAASLVAVIALIALSASEAVALAGSVTIALTTATAIGAAVVHAARSSERRARS